MRVILRKSERFGKFGLVNISADESLNRKVEIRVRTAEIHDHTNGKISNGTINVVNFVVYRFPYDHS